MHLLFLHLVVQHCKNRICICFVYSDFLVMLIGELCLLCLITSLRFFAIPLSEMRFLSFITWMWLQCIRILFLRIDFRYDRHCNLYIEWMPPPDCVICLIVNSTFGCLWTNRKKYSLQPPSIVTDEICAACDFNRPGKTCMRELEWVWRGETYTAKRRSVFICVIWSSSLSWVNTCSFVFVLSNLGLNVSSVVLSCRLIMIWSIYCALKLLGKPVKKHFVEHIPRLWADWSRWLFLVNTCIWGIKLNRNNFPPPSMEALQGTFVTYRRMSSRASWKIGWKSIVRRYVGWRLISLYLCP